MRAPGGDCELQLALANFAGHEDPTNLGLLLSEECEDVEAVGVPKVEVDESHLHVGIWVLEEADCFEGCGGHERSSAKRPQVALKGDMDVSRVVDDENRGRRVRAVMLESEEHGSLDGVFHRAGHVVEGDCKDRLARALHLLAHHLSPQTQWTPLVELEEKVDTVTSLQAWVTHEKGATRGEVLDDEGACVAFASEHHGRRRDPSTP